MYWHKNPFWFEYLWPRQVWRKPTDEKVLYVTFDDGPIPGLTEWVLDVLEQHKAKATFFCVGDNVRKHKGAFSKVVQAGHAVGNHTHNHLNGWKTKSDAYTANVALCQQYLGTAPRLFRPPYGRITRQQSQVLRQAYQVIMWDVLSGDFDQRLPPERCLQNTVRATQPGSIVIFHDSLKARKNLQFVLPRYLAHFQTLGYRFQSL